MPQKLTRDNLPARLEVDLSDHVRGVFSQSNALVKAFVDGAPDECRRAFDKARAAGGCLHLDIRFGMSGQTDDPNVTIIVHTEDDTFEARLVAFGPPLN